MNQKIEAKQIDLQQKINSLESQLIFQEDIIERLNQIVTRQQKEIALLREQLSMILHKMSSVQSSNIAPIEEESLPPHY